MIVGCVCYFYIYQTLGERKIVLCGLVVPAAFHVFGIRFDHKLALTDNAF